MFVLPDDLFENLNKTKIRLTEIHFKHNNNDKPFVKFTYIALYSFGVKILSPKLTIDLKRSGDNSSVPVTLFL